MLVPALLALVMLGPASAARGQVAASASITSDYRYRGLTVSDARPAISLDLAYDAAGGVYAGGSLVAADAPSVGPRILGALADIGYARRVGGGLTLDAGINHASFFGYGYGYGYGYGGQSSETTEAYVGVSRGALRAYLYYSPHYFVSGVKTLYLSLDGAVRPARRLRLFGHVGVLDTVGAPQAWDGAARYDVRVGGAVEFKGGEVQLAWTTRGGGAAGPPGAPARRSALVLGASLFF